MSAAHTGNAIAPSIHCAVRLRAGPPFPSAWRRSLLLLCGIWPSFPCAGTEIGIPELAPTSAATVSAVDNTAHPLPSLGRQLVYDTGYIVTSPVRWDAEDWKWFGLASAAVIGAGALFDKRESDEAADRERPLDKLAARLEPFGAQYSVLTIAGFYAGGKLVDSPRAVAVGEDGLTASVIASGIITPFIKWVVGRERPAATENPREFHPFSGNYSFPSGHATQAFTVASVTAAHYDSLWIDTTAYTVATLVGYARHQHNAHWTSDIAGGAVVGLTVGHTVVKLNQDNRRAHIAIVSTQTGPMAALVVPFS